MEGKERTLKKFTIRWYTKFVNIFCRCLLPKRHETKKLYGSFLKIKPSIEPETINWLNFGTSKQKYFERTVIFYSFMLAILVGIFFLITWMEKQLQAITARIPNITCNETIVQEQAFVDYLSGYSDRNGDFHCFCNGLMD